MDDRILETSCSNFDQAVTLSNENFGVDRVPDTPKEEAEKIEGNVDSACKDSASSGNTEESYSCEGQTLPIIPKIEGLSKKIQKIKENYEHLREEVKGIPDSLLDFESVSALQKFSKECEDLRTKYVEECELLRNKCLEECCERKRLYNEVIELKGNIRVFCRCRPLKQDEIANGTTSVVDFNSSQENEMQIICSDSSRKHFKFDHVFKPEDNQEDVFLQTLPLVTSVLDGYNVCIFAYGQTGTGKTYTMEGTSENRGVNYRTLEELFKLSKSRSSIMRYELCVSMLEVYNEKIRDLLVENSNQPEKRLEIKQSAEGTQEVPGLVEARVHNTEEVWRLLKSGSQARSVGSTTANELSSRSHCLLRVTIAGKNLVNGQMTRSHLWLVDLAGSERVGKIDVEGDRLKESQFINKSLSALGDVISALASKSSHIPYRNSKLTHMLQSSLGGDCKTLMFVQISPNTADLGETLCSLNFASRVRGVEHGPARKQSDHGELLRYKQLLEKAKQDEKEMKKLQDTAQALQLRLVSRESICRNLQEKVRDLENQLAEERKTRMKQESRALASISTHSVLSNPNNQPSMDKKPPLAPSRLRPPLRRITNFMPIRSPVPVSRNSSSMSTSFLPTVNEEGKENPPLPRAPLKVWKEARRGSMAVVGPSPSSTITGRAFQPKRRASVATLGRESTSNTMVMMTPLQRSSMRTSRPDVGRHSLVPSTITGQAFATKMMMMTPLQRSSMRTPRPDNRGVGRHSLVWDPQQVSSSRVCSPPPPLRAAASSEAAAVTFRSSSRKFRGSPPPQTVWSWKPKHPTVVALQKKHLGRSP
ncbi:kinesin-like protein KIN-14S isoform X2 [Andrographis paniculata]|uniref:kinesin-like protein KIN-14S isoform X2 n=1 Tax=Andrographis paniculata TaxID=175694 RepID=UPI0021E74EF9|nr:kinesin-like protein KIN-14S isoform X2 [Andrographis paniculata]